MRSSSVEEDDFIVSRAFPTSNKPFGSLNTRPPANGEEYLRLVNEEANKIPAVKIAPSPANKQSDDKIAGWVKRGWAEMKKEENTVDKLMPNKEWEIKFLDGFEGMRQKLRRWIDKQASNINQAAETLEMPKHRNKTAWYKFCYGSAGTVPTLSIISKVDQQTTLSLISYHTEWLSDNEISKAQSQWIFALLLRVDKLLTPNQTSLLRELCRKCIDIRKNLSARDMDDINFASANIIISIIRGIFGQKDL
ncbi:3615_t:CDS:2 [Paraglomus occultum]|uniref:Gem-associated protein 2 n=1 Tax=Paraglomus occultum TaxID=144539 RepID=A0A9N9B5S3_9GLOM|nr:3615_t:CDS:2 [Paraglomus occultum]